MCLNGEVHVYMWGVIPGNEFYGLKFSMHKLCYYVQVWNLAWISQEPYIQAHSFEILVARTKT